MKQQILLIEDEPGIADNVVYALSTEGFEVQWAQTGEDGIHLMRDTAPALVLLDVGLPDTNGFDIARRIRQESGVPIIFVTARSDEIDRIVGLELGADDYVVKPFSPRELSARVRAVLRRASADTRNSQTETSSSGAFAIDEGRHRISFYGAALDLSRYEFRLLKILVQHPGRVFTRDRLMELAWDDPGMSLDRTVDTHIKTIRQKLRILREDLDPIITHRGVGYSLREDL